MTHGEPRALPGRREEPSEPDAWLDEVASSAAAASRAPVDLLGEYLPMLADAAIDGRRPEAWELDTVREMGRRAASRGVGAARAVDLYLSAAWRLWRELPVVARSSDPEKVRSAAEQVLRVLDEAVGVLVDGHQSERREMIRHEEALRRAFVDDLLRGDADVSRMVARAEPFGLDLGKSHHVALADGGGAVDRAATVLERVVVDRFGDRDVLVATKDGRVVVVVPGTPITASSPDRTGDVGSVIHRELGRLRSGGRWRVAAGRAFPGAYGVARSYEEAREALAIAARLDLDADVVDARDLLVYRVLARDQAAIADLVRDVLGPLVRVRGGAEVLLGTLHEYFRAGDVATEAARVGPHGHLPPGQGHAADRPQRRQARRAVHAARGRARRPPAGVAGQAAAHRPLTARPAAPGLAGRGALRVPGLRRSGCAGGGSRGPCSPSW